MYSVSPPANGDLPFFQSSTNSLESQSCSADDVKQVAVCHLRLYLTVVFGQLGVVQLAREKGQRGYVMPSGPDREHSSSSKPSNGQAKPLYSLIAAPCIAAAISDMS
ncbi:MAG: hypothetical protein FRX49_10065 [Trebouxia sp. A1-2]|nr:MAG: hypothetical protein FRX49_10065 [Trebouxia sp. A1-2]